MKLNINKSSSNMYDNTATTNPLSTVCEHKCKYCSTHTFTNRYENLNEKYSGEPRLVESVLKGNTGEGHTIFVCNMIDMFAEHVPDEHILRILEECRKYQNNTYLFQTKNPKRLLQFMEYYPEHCEFGTTIETNREAIIEELTEAPSIKSRVQAMKELRSLLWIKYKDKDWKTFVTIEPALAFDVEELDEMIENICPDYVNIGADSKVYKFPKIYNNLKLPEPDADDLKQLIRRMKLVTSVRIKDNLDRLLGELDDY